jgi:hypothetical protein
MSTEHIERLFAAIARLQETSSQLSAAADEIGEIAAEIGGIGECLEFMDEGEAEEAEDEIGYRLHASAGMFYGEWEGLGAEERLAFDHALDVVRQGESNNRA